MLSKNKSYIIIMTVNAIVFFTRLTYLAAAHFFPAVVLL